MGGGGSRTLGDKIREEQEYEQSKKLEAEAANKPPEELPKEEQLTAKKFYNLGHIGSCFRQNSIGQINNMSVLEKYENYLRDDLKEDENISHNFILSGTF